MIKLINFIKYSKGFLKVAPSYKYKIPHGVRIYIYMGNAPVTLGYINVDLYVGLY